LRYLLRLGGWLERLWLVQMYVNSETALYCRAVSEFT
jgi:hypothetical protein